ncbi:aspartate/glutamate racemase family protein [Salipaludibacillus aurantiacus]|uniref:Aspartate racemase n=1 Tax=Salipaludibacillus aurantiacus TaxID=1601833 RepID=A0A1H9V9K1_9BACI|nr:aspartate/glutamate racemase family protein [Salipaludibacillus aurantiacus]SES18211.1 aspartate racemase [Salipaludibacillus aurantiacus]
MKTLGLIGGLSWESTADYYRLINTSIQKRLGGLHSAKCLMYSFDFQEIAALQHEGKWKQAAKAMADAALKLETAGADAIVICSNTMHKTAEDIEQHLSVPLLHIGDATAASMKEKGISTAVLLGTAFTMEQDFYKKKLEHSGLTVVTPNAEDRKVIHSVIFDELCRGIIKNESKERMLSIINGVNTAGETGIILGCTELPMLIKPEDLDMPVFDTTHLHSKMAADFLLNNI